jgi:hypothetical protein
MHEEHYVLGAGAGDALHAQDVPDQYSAAAMTDAVWGTSCNEVSLAVL